MSYEHVDLTFLKSFTGGKPDKMTKYINIFLKQAPKQLEDLEAYLKAEDWEQLRVTAHSLKPQCKYMGISALETKIPKIEQFAEDASQRVHLPVLVRDVQTIGNAAMNDLKQVIETLNA